MLVWVGVHFAKCYLVADKNHHMPIRRTRMTQWVRAWHEYKAEIIQFYCVICCHRALGIFGVVW